MKGKSRKKKPSIEEIVAAIKKMTMAEVAELVKVLRGDIEK